MITKFYFIRDEKQRPVETVCLLVATDGRSWAKGRAVCHSEKDIPNKKWGKHIAYHRALKALTERSHLINPDGQFARAEYCEDLKGRDKVLIGHLVDAIPF